MEETIITRVLKFGESVELRQEQHSPALASSQVCSSSWVSARPYTETRARMTAATANSREGDKYARLMLIQASQSGGSMGESGRGILGMEMRRVCGTLLRVWKTFTPGKEFN